MTTGHSGVKFKLDMYLDLILYVGINLLNVISLDSLTSILSL